MAHNLFIGILIIFIAGFAVEQWLKWLNHKARATGIPDLLQDVYSTERYQTYVEYKRESRNFGLWVSYFSFALTFFMLIYGFVAMDDWAVSLTSNSILQGLIFFGIIGLLSEILTTPFDIYDTFVIEQKFGFNTTTARTYIADKLKSLLLAIVIGGGMLSLLIWLYALLDHNFWWLAWIAITLFSLFLTVFYSTLIVPIFNKQTPLEPGELRETLSRLAERTGFTISNIYVIDGSRRSNRANAYFSGFGAKRRIVLYDTLMKNQSNEEIAAILAHEIGHYRKKHIPKSFLLSVLTTGIMLYLFSLILGHPVIFEAMGASHDSFHLGLIVFILLYTPISMALSIAGNYLSRRFEFQADAFAAKYADVSAFTSSLKKLAADNLSDLTPHPWFVFFHYSHPPLAERIRKII